MPLANPSHADVVTAATTLPRAAHEAVVAGAAALKQLSQLSQQDTASAPEAMVALMSWHAGQAAIDAAILRVAALAVRGGASITEVAAALGIRRQSLGEALARLDESKRRQEQK